MKKAYILTMALCAGLIMASTSADAETYIRKTPQITSKTTTKPATQNNGALPSDSATDHAKIVASACVPGRWEEQGCLKAISGNVLVMASNYGVELQERGKKADAETLKQHCAAATAATRGEYPAYAMRSAFVECANIVYDIKEKAGLSPDLSQYQLLVGAVQCLDKSAACAAFEHGMQRYR